MQQHIKLFLYLIILLFTPLFSSAQDTTGKTILVLDASGSMWGQIDGISKIEIAQSVIDNLLATLPDDGLVARTID